MRVASDINHSGVVSAIDGNRVDVAVVPESACGSCRAKAICGAGDSEDRVISVTVPDPRIYRVGEEVAITMRNSVGIAAAVLVYVAPLALLLATLAVCLSATAIPEAAAGLVSLGVVGIYYLVLGIFRNRLAGRIVFNVMKMK